MLKKEKVKGNKYHVLKIKVAKKVQRPSMYFLNHNYYTLISLLKKYLDLITQILSNKTYLVAYLHSLPQVFLKS